MTNPYRLGNKINPKTTDLATRIHNFIDNLVLTIINTKVNDRDTPILQQKENHGLFKLICSLIWKLSFFSCCLHL